MAWHWSKYISVAEELHEKSNGSEAKLRSATSRAYYGAFMQVRNEKGYKKEKGSEIHQRIIKDLKESEDDNEITIGSLLSDLRVERNDADYDDDYKTTPDETKTNIDKAKKIQELLFK